MSEQHRFGLRLAAGVPTRGRPAILAEKLAELADQTRPPDAIFVAYYQDADLGDVRERFPHVQFLRGTGGSCAQRNTLLNAVGDDYDVLLITDDDFFAHRDYLLRIEEAFANDATLVGTTGKLLANGAKGPGYTVEFARDLLGKRPAAPTLTQLPPRIVENTDGNNMAFRLATLQEHGIRFDERMPGYAWYEDIDFARRMMKYGKLAVVEAAEGVHLGAKVGKTSGVRYGYSQVANPIYLHGKGSFPLRWLFLSIGRNVGANLLGAFRPEPYIDRKGRLRGNGIAFFDLLRGRMRPDRILELH